MGFHVPTGAWHEGGCESYAWACPSLCLGRGWRACRRWSESRWMLAWSMRKFDHGDVAVVRFPSVVCYGDLVTRHACDLVRVWVEQRRRFACAWVVLEQHEVSFLKACVSCMQRGVAVSLDVVLLVLVVVSSCRGHSALRRRFACESAEVAQTRCVGRGPKHELTRHEVARVVECWVERYAPRKRCVTRRTCA